VVLTAKYDHSNDLFVGKNQVLVQKDTDGQKTSKRRLKNTIDVYIRPPIPLGHPLKKGIVLDVISIKDLLDSMDLNISGGVTERMSIHGVKLMNTGPHSQQTNHGFSRQSGDGNFFNY
jgi:hypothetical protein